MMMTGSFLLPQHAPVNSFAQAKKKKKKGRTKIVRARLFGWAENDCRAANSNRADPTPGATDRRRMSTSASREVLDSLAQFATGLERLLDDIRGINALGDFTAALQAQRGGDLAAAKRRGLPPPQTTRYGTPQPPAGTRGTATTAYHQQSQQQQHTLTLQQRQQLSTWRRGDTVAALAQLRQADARLRAAFCRLNALRRGQATLERLDASFARRSSACVSAVLYRCIEAHTRFGAALQAAVQEREAAAMARAHPVSAQRAVCVAGRVGSAASTAPRRARGTAQGPYPPLPLLRSSLLLEYQSPPSAASAVPEAAAAADAAAAAEEAAAAAGEDSTVDAAEAVAEAAEEAAAAVAAVAAAAACRKTQPAAQTPLALEVAQPSPLPVLMDGVPGGAGEDDDEGMGLDAPPELMGMNSIDVMWPMQ